MASMSVVWYFVVQSLYDFERRQCRNNRARNHWKCQKLSVFHGKSSLCHITCRYDDLIGILINVRFKIHSHSTTNNAQWPVAAREALKACPAEMENPVKQESQAYPENQAMLHNSVHWENHNEISFIWWSRICHIGGPHWPPIKIFHWRFRWILTTHKTFHWRFY